MAIHTDLPIYRTGVQLLTLAVKVQEQMPRGVKRSLGDKISQHCVEMLDLMALANATKHGERAEHIKQLMTRLRAMPDEQVFAAGNSYLGLIGQASHPHSDRIKVAQALLARGHCVKSDLSKIYRRSGEQ